MTKFKQWFRSYSARFIDLFDTVIAILTLGFVSFNFGLYYRIRNLKNDLKNK